MALFFFMQLFHIPALGFPGLPCERNSCSGVYTPRCVNFPSRIFFFFTHTGPYSILPEFFFLMDGPVPLNQKIPRVEDARFQDFLFFDTKHSISISS